MKKIKLFKDYKKKYKNHNLWSTGYFYCIVFIYIILFIFTNNKVVTISVDSDKQILSFDGNRIHELQKNDKIIIDKSSDTLNFISLDKNNFL